MIIYTPVIYAPYLIDPLPLSLGINYNNYFILSFRSRLYFEYCLCCAINGRRPTSYSPFKLVTKPTSSDSGLCRQFSIDCRRRRVETGGVASIRDSTMSSALPDELWSDGEETVAMEIFSEDTTQPGQGMLI